MPDQKNQSRLIICLALALSACSLPTTQALPATVPVAVLPTQAPASSPTATLALTPTPAATATPRVGITTTFEITSAGVTRTFWLYQPSTYERGTPVPLVFNLHGLSSDAPGQQALSGFTPKAESEDFIVVYPNGLNHAWNVDPNSEDVQFTRDLITQLEAVYSIDPKRIYVTGMSNGGGMVNRIGCELSDLIAAIAPVAGAYYAWQQCEPARPMPVISFHGIADQVVPYEGLNDQLQPLPPIHDWAIAWANRNSCEPTPTVTQPAPTVTAEAWGNCSHNADVVLYTLTNHGHSWPGSAMLPQITSQAINATDLIWEFFRAHPRP